MLCVYFMTGCIKPGNYVGKKDLAVVAGNSKFLFDAMLGLSHQCGKSMQKSRTPSVLSWAVSLENVLEDPVGINTFKEFLKREFSAENIKFWILCEHYKYQADKNQRKKLAQDIIDRHLADGAPEAINIDSHTRQKTIEGMFEASQDLLVPAQKQIFKLMKFDCYQRFLKSDLFTLSLTAEKLGKPLPFEQVTGIKSPKKTRSRSKSRDRNRLFHITKLNMNLIPAQNSSNETREGTKYYSDNSPSTSEDCSPRDELEEKKRKSLLPWQKGKTKGTESERSNSRSPVLPERGTNFRRSKRRIEKKQGGNTGKSNSKSSGNTLEVAKNSGQRHSLEEKYSQQLILPQAQEYRNYCRLIFPDASTAILNQEQNESVGEAIQRMLVKRGVSETALEALVRDTTQVVDLNSPLSNFCGKEIVMEQRTVIRLELPSKKVIAVRAKPEKTCFEVLKPVLKKYGIDITKVNLHFENSKVPLNMNGELRNADRCKICAKFPEENSDAENESFVKGQRKKSIQERKDVTSYMFEEIMRGKICFYYDELGILDLENSDIKEMRRPSLPERSLAISDTPRRNSFSIAKDEKSKACPIYSSRASIHEGMGIKIQLNEVNVPQESNTTPRRSAPKNVHYRDSCDFTSIWNRVQKQIDDQRGLEVNCELPEFLRLRSDSSSVQHSTTNP